MSSTTSLVLALIFLITFTFYFILQTPDDATLENFTDYTVNIDLTHHESPPSTHNDTHIPPEQEPTPTEQPQQPPPVVTEPNPPSPTQITNTTNKPESNSVTTDPSEIPFPNGSTNIVGDIIEELKIYSSSSSNDSAKCSQRKDQITVNLCRVLGGNYCIRYTPTQELYAFWIILPLYSADQKATKLLYELHGNFINYVKLFGFQVQTIEVVFLDQQFIKTQPNNEPYELQYKADWIFNMRENLVNVGAKKLPENWQYIAWIDAHILWQDNKYFFEDVVVELNRNNIVHMFGSTEFYSELNTSSYYEDGFGKLWNQLKTDNLPSDRQCGIAWATRRDIFEGINGVLDVCVGTKCDLYQNYPMIGLTYTEECKNPEYARAVKTWQENAMKVFGRKVGYVEGNIVHFAHCFGNCRTSDYSQLTWALDQRDYDPYRDLERDKEGRLQFKDNFVLARMLWEIYGGFPRNG